MLFWSYEVHTGTGTLINAGFLFTTNNNFIQPRSIPNFNQMAIIATIDDEGLVTLKM